MKLSTLVVLLSAFSVAPAFASSRSANQYVCKTSDLTITFNIAGNSGKPTLQVQRGGQNPRIDTEVSLEKTSLGTLVIIEKRHIPDLATQVQALLLPAVNLNNDRFQSEFSTLLITTTYPTTFFGTGGVDGPLSNSISEPISCSADFVMS